MEECEERGERKCVKNVRKGRGRKRMYTVCIYCGVHDSYVK